MGIISGGAGGGGGTKTVLIVRRPTSINPWDGTALPFTSVSFDPGGLWSAVTNHFTAAVAGWYQVSVAPLSNVGPITDTAPGGTIEIANSGAGDNISVSSSPINTLATTWLYAPLLGVTHLDASDTIDIEGTGGGTLAVLSASLTICLLT